MSIGEELEQFWQKVEPEGGSGSDLALFYGRGFEGLLSARYWYSGSIERGEVILVNQ